MRKALKSRAPEEPRLTTTVDMEVETYSILYKEDMSTFVLSCDQHTVRSGESVTCELSKVLNGGPSLFLKCELIQI